MRNLLPVPVHSSRRFIWSGVAGRLGIADWSDFNGQKLDDRLFIDAEDRAFEVLSERTGERKLFVYENTVYPPGGEDAEDGVTVFKSTDGLVEIHLLND